MPSAYDAIQKWPTIINPPPLVLQVVSFNGTPYTEYGSTGAWLYLKGMQVTLGNNTYDAHITITKPPVTDSRSDEWNLFHFTVERAFDSHVFYEIRPGGSFRMCTNVLSQEGKNSRPDVHYRKKDTQINDKTLADTLEHDIRLILQRIV